MALPIRNPVPRLRRTALPQFLWGKFQMLVLGADIPSYISIPEAQR